MSRQTDLQTLQEAISDAAHKHLRTRKDPPVDKNNFVLDAIYSDEERALAAKVQSKSIKTGNMLEELANSLASSTKGLKRSRTPFCGPGVSKAAARRIKEQSVPRKDHGKCLVISKLPQDKINRHADRIKEKMVAACKRGEDFTLKALLREIRQSRRALLTGKLDEDATVYIVDLAFQSGDKLYFAEVKTSGNLDSKNAPDELRNILRAVLALGDTAGEVVPVAACSIASDRTTALAKVFPEEALWIGEDFWNRLLPGKLRYEDMIATMQKVLPDYADQDS